MCAYSPSTTWQAALADVVTDPLELLSLLELTPEQLPYRIDTQPTFPLRVPRGFVRRMKKGDPHDPLLRQVLSVQAENQLYPEFNTDPLGELSANPVPGLLHKYHGRVLITATSVCAVHCRYCFRRHFPYSENQLTQAHWETLLQYLREDTSIHEVILSGGDPLALSDRRLKTMIDDISAITHIQTVRFHSRVPIVLPERITESFIDSMQSRLRIVCVVHCNHAQEIDETVTQALQKLQAAGVTLLNQSVLLQGVNDTKETLIALSEALFSVGVLPYYLHLLDKVQGAAHFDVRASEARRLWDAMVQQLPGYLVPRLVHEVKGALSKVVV